MAKITLTRLACSFNPASISVEYTSGSKKEYKQFPVVFGNFSEPGALFDTLVCEYPTYFGESSIHPNKLRNFIATIIQKAPKLDLTNVSKDVLDRYKQQMNREFERNAIKPDDPKFQYDMRVDFPDAEEPCEWDD